MAVLTAPGVYVEEIPSGVRPITAASTSTAAFFGVAQRGPVGELRRIFNFTEFQNFFGGFLNDGHYLAHSVLSFFRNGGAQAYIGRVAVDPDTASVTILDRSAAPAASVRFSATSPGAWGDELRVIVSSAAAADPGNQFNVTVYQDNPRPGEDPIALESFVNLSMDPQDPNYIANVINGNSLYILAADIATNPGNGFSESGDIVVDGEDLLADGQRVFRININNDGVRPVDLTAALEGGDLTVLETIRAAMQATIQALPPLRESTPANSYSGATVTIVGGSRLRITAGGVASPSSKVEVFNATNLAQNAAGALMFGPLNGGVNVFGSATMRPQNTPDDDYYFLGDDSVDGPVSAVTAGSDGDEPQTNDYVQALSLLDTVRDVSLIAVPGIGDPALADAGMGYCRTRPLSDCFFIADMDRFDDELDEAITYRDAINVPNSYGAVYFPWLRMLDPTGATAEPIAVPPSGFVAGIYARIDGSRGVWKAPAGTEALVNGAVGVITELRDVEQGLLNNANKSVAVIRRFPSAGLVLWGARTQNNDPEYRYISVRRTAIMLRKSIYDGIQWAVFEPNDEPLWAALRLNIGSFMMTLFRQGAFQGSTPSQAFFVKCDSETTTQADIDNGIVNVLVGFAPLKPAEFVVVKISQMAGQSS
jgi:uncharacterized protein